MKKYIYIVVSTFLFIALTIFSSSFIFAEEPTKNVRVAISDQESLIMDRIVSYALLRSGYEAVFSRLGMRTAINSTNQGDTDILATQAKGLEKIYPNLVMIPIPVSYADIIVYTKVGSNLHFNSWEDLAGLRVAYYEKNYYIETNIPSTVKESVGVNENEYIYDLLVNNEVDVLVLPLTEIMDRILPQGIEVNSIIERVTTYSYINKDNIELVSILTEAYTQMIQDGTMKNIKEQTSLNPDAEKIVLHISSYSTDMLWERDVVKGVTDTLAQESNILYYNFPLNLKRVSNIKSQYELMENQVRSNFVLKSPDVVIVSDNSALDFVIKSYNKLFIGTPIIFCGINDYDDSLIRGHEEHITGITEEISAYDTVNNALEIYPKTQNIFLVVDYTESGKLWKNTIQKQLQPFENTLNITYCEDVPFEETVKQISSFDTDTLVICGTYYRDSTGSYVTERELLTSLVNASTQPVFSLAGVCMGFGLIGGKVVDGINQGAIAGNMALKVLQGTPIQDIPVITDENISNVWLYDYKVAKKYNIDTRRFRPEHKALNKSLSMKETDPVAFTLFISFSCMTMLIILLLLFFMHKQKIQKEKIDYIAMHDHITGLNNRAAFDLRMSELLANKKTGGIFLLDLDGFKAINDAYGHPIGDICLKEVANRFIQSEIAYDMVCRVGGDEFIIILLGDNQSISSQAEYFTNLFKKPFIINNLSFKITASIGIALFPLSGTNTKNILQCADVALYEAKDLGKNQYVIYTNYMSDTISRQADVTQILNNAAETNELFTVYQPQISLLDGKILGFEALARLNSISLGFISPVEFIPLAESTGKIVDLGLYVLEKTCYYVKELLSDGLDFKYASVNISTIQINQTNFIQDIMEILDRTGVNPKYIQLEITENVFMREAEANIQKLTKLREMGISIALDDFGTGYSSMKYLAELPINTLKMDKSFIDQIETDEKKRTIAHLIINTAHALGLKVVAEGVERKEQKFLLEEMNCDAIQGYLYSPPLSPEQFKQFSTTHYN